MRSISSVAIDSTWPRGAAPAAARCPPRGGGRRPAGRPPHVPALAYDLVGEPVQRGQVGQHLLLHRPPPGAARRRRRARRDPRPGATRTGRPPGPRSCAGARRPPPPRSAGAGRCRAAGAPRSRAVLGQRRGEDLGQVADGTGRPVASARACRCIRHDVSQPTRTSASARGLEGPQLLVGHRHGRLGNFTLNVPRTRSTGRTRPRPRPRTPPRGAPGRPAGRRSATQAACGSSAGRRRAAGGAERRQVVGLARRGARSARGCARRPGAPGGGMVVADHLEQLGPEDADHRGARPGRDHHGLGPAVEVGLHPG